MPLKKEDQLSLNAGQKYCRMLHMEHSAILLTFIKLPFVIKNFVLSFFEWLLKTCFTVLTTVLWRSQTRCKMNMFIKKRFFHSLKEWVNWTYYCLGKLWWNHGTMTRAHHKSEGLHLWSISLTLFILDTDIQVLWQTELRLKAAFHQGLHCLLRWKTNFGTEIYQFMDILTDNPLKY